MRTSIYIHVPFCAYKCHFCDFAVVVNAEHLFDKYFDQVEKEIEYYLDTDSSARNIKTLYFGGGTPGLVSPKYIDRLVNRINDLAGIVKEAEISIETTPDTINSVNLAQWKEIGINRLSVGIESFDQGQLKRIGRKQAKTAAELALQSIKSSEFDNFNIDLMYGLPGQSTQMFLETVDLLLKYSPPHISAYCLTLEENTPLYRQVQLAQDDRSLLIPDDPTVTHMYFALLERLAAKDIRQYEVSNFAKDGYQCLHNLNYWQGQSFHAFGLGAFRYLNDQRTANTKNIKRYLADFLDFDFSETISQEKRISEYIMLNLRLSSGLSLNSLKENFYLDLETEKAEEISRWIKEGCITRKGDRLILSPQGIMLSNSVIADLI